MAEFNSPSENPEYKQRLKELEEKEKRVLKEYRAAKLEYEEKEREWDDICEEIGLLKNEYGVYPNVR